MTRRTVLLDERYVAEDRPADAGRRVERCACGAMRIDGGPWVFRNEARRHKVAWR